MGGYAAILYGCLLGVDTVMAFSPQTLLDPIYPLSPHPSLPCRVPDLAPIVARTPSTRIQIICGEDDLVDLFYAARLASLPNVEVLTTSNADHLIMAWLHERGALDNAIRDWIGGGRSPIFRRAEVLDDQAIADGIAAAIPAFHRGEYASAARALAPIAAAKPRWVGAQCMFGRALIKSGESVRAEAVLRSAIALSPSLPEPPRYLARALMSQKKLNEALQFLARSVELLPEWAEAYYDIGDCHVMAGREAEARSAFLKAATLKPSWEMPKRRLAELGVVDDAEQDAVRS